MTETDFKSEICKLSPIIAAMGRSSSELAALATRFTSSQDLTSALNALNDPTKLSAFEEAVAGASILANRLPARQPASPPYAWVGPIVSVIVLLGFFTMLFLLRLQPGFVDTAKGNNVQNSSNAQTVQTGQKVQTDAADNAKGSNVQGGQNVYNVLFTLVGALGAAFTQVVNYWLGSSKGSADKTNLLASQNASR